MPRHAASSSAGSLHWQEAAGAMHRNLQEQYITILVNGPCPVRPPLPRDTVGLCPASPPGMPAWAPLQGVRLIVGASVELLVAVLVRVVIAAW
eukprot:4654471-Pyramimonas_sp.AAC.1